MIPDVFSLPLPRKAFLRSSSCLRHLALRLQSSSQTSAHRRPDLAHYEPIPTVRASLASTADPLPFSAAPPVPQSSLLCSRTRSNDASTLVPNPSRPSLNTYCSVQPPEPHLDPIQRALGQDPIKPSKQPDSEPVAQAEPDPNVLNRVIADVPEPGPWLPLWIWSLD